MDACDICGSDKNVVAGRWIFYCPKHKDIDVAKTYENEVEPCLESGEMPDLDALAETLEVIC